MTWTHHGVPYNNLPDLPPRYLIETTQVLKKAIIANRNLAELKGTCLRLPRPEILLNTIILQESKDSSEIENIVTTQDALYQGLLNPNEGLPKEVKEVLRYREAIYTALDGLKMRGFITSSLTIKIMQKLRGIDVGLRTLAGTKLANPTTQQVIYTPPDPKYIPLKLKNWEVFINENSDYDPLISMAILHYQFEAIHPFADGNGRTGRILNILYLMQKNLITEPVLYHSSYIIQHKSDYYKLLRDVTENNAWEPWILFMLEAINETAQKTILFIQEMLNLKDDIHKIIKGISQKLPSYELTELLFSYPYIKIKTLTDTGLGTRQTASNYLEELVKKDVLIVKKVGKENYYLNHQLMSLITN